MILTNGSKGPIVQAFQQALNRRGYGPLVEDGYFGPKTTAAWMRYTSQFGRARATVDDTDLRAFGVSTSSGGATNPAFTSGGASAIPPGGTAAGGANTLGPSMVSDIYGEAAGAISPLRQASMDYLGVPLEYVAGAVIGAAALIFIWKRK